MCFGGFDSVEELLNADPRTMVGGELTEWMSAMDQLRSRTEGQYLAGAGEWDARGVWGEEGARSGAAWLSRRCDQRRGTASGVLRDAAKLRDLPLTAAACDRLGTTKVRTMLRFVTDRTRTAYVEQEAFLLGQAEPLTVDETARMMEFWALFADPDGADPGDRTRNEVHLSKTIGGRWMLSGNLDAVLGAELRNALEWRADQLYRSYRETDDGIERSHAQLMAEALAILLMDAGRGATSDGFPEQPSIGIIVDISLIDDLLRQRAHAASESHAGPADDRDGDIAGADDAGDPDGAGNMGRIERHDDIGSNDCRSGGDDIGGAAEPRSEPDPGSSSDIDTNTNTDIDADPGSEPGSDIESESRIETETETDHGSASGARAAFDPWVRCHIDGTDPIRGETARRLACEAGIYRIITDGASIILDAGRTIRTASPGQRRAMGARSPTCEFPGCDIPHRWTRCHHIKWWVRDHGESNIADMANVCDRHHHLLHEGHWTMHRLASGQVEVRRPDGAIFQPTRDATRDVA